MTNVEAARKDEHGGLSAARAEFASSLGRRLDAIQSAISAFEQNPISASHRDNLLRRLHALGASAKILGFAAAAESLSRAEQQLRTGLAETLPDDVVIVRSLLANLSALVLRGSYSLPPAPPSASSGPPLSPSPIAQGPWCVLVCGSPVLAETLKGVGSESPGFELVHSQDTSRLRELCAMYGPDVLVLDASLDDIVPVVQRLREAPETASVQFVVAQASDDMIETLKDAGAHTVLTANFSPIALWRAANRSRTEERNLPSPREPLGDIGLRELCDRLARELKRGLFEAADANSQAAVVPLGEGTEVRAAIWAAMARIREILVSQSEGRVHFGPGPDGSVVLAPGAGLGLRGRTLADSASIDLTGRRILVADDDPAVAWFVGGTLRAAGAEVREAQDGRRALSVIQTWWPELIVSDVLMPGIDGFALCREVKRDVALRDVPVILLSWKEDLLFRLRELGADADAYVRKEASASSLVDRVRELLWPRISLERRLRIGQEVRGRLDGITPRTLIDAACRLGRHVRITLRDASAHFDVRIRDGALRAVSRTRSNGIVVRGHSALAALLGVSAGRFSVVDDDQPPDDDFAQLSLEDVLRTPILRARAAQRVLSGAALGVVEHVSLDPDAFADELSMLPLSLRPLVDELLRGTAPNQLLASGATSLNSLEALLSDAARRGAVHTITGKDGEDLLTREILALSAPPSEQPPQVPQVESPTFSFQLTPSPMPAGARRVTNSLPETREDEPPKKKDASDEFDWASEASWDDGLTATTEPQVAAERSSPYSRPRISADWGASEKRKADEAIAADLGRSLAATSPLKAPSRKADASLVPVTMRSEGDAAPTNSTVATPSETPELAEVIASTASDTVSQAIPAYALKTAHFGLPIASGFDKNLTAPTPIVREKPSTDAAPADAPVAPEPPKHQPSAAPAADTAKLSAARITPAYGTTVAETKQEAAPSQANVAEGEVVFPLLSSTAPATRSQHAVSAPPIVQLSQLQQHDTLHSALAPTEDTGKVQDPTDPAQDGPAPLGDTDPQSQTGLPQTAQEPSDATRASEPVAADAAPDIESTAANVNAAPKSTHVSQPPSRSSRAPRRNYWLVHLSLALTAGLLSFTVALPIIQRLRTRPAPVEGDQQVQAVASDVSSAAPAPSLEGLPAPAATAVTTQDRGPAETNTDLPPGITVAPDKGLLTLKTSGVHSIFVDDEFIGRGPERTVTLTQGQHRVRTSLNGEEHTETVEVVAGRLIQRSLDTNGN